ncbi:MAG: S8 family serine peptidase, partial [Pseudomonadota bacterium]
MNAFGFQETDTRIATILKSGKVGNDLLVALQEADSALKQSDGASGRVPVLIAFEVMDNNGKSITRFQSHHQSTIKHTADTIIASIKPEYFRVVRRYTSINAVAGEINLDGIAAILENPNVLRIDADIGGSGSMLQAAPLVNIDDVRIDRGLTGSGVTVAVLDSGIATAHPDLAASIVDQVCFADSCPNGGGSAEDDNGHGTNVSGIIASAGTIAPLGGAPDVNIVAIKVLDGNAAFSGASVVLAGLDYIINNAPDVDLINMSLGTNELFSGDCDSSRSFTIAFATAINTLRDRGVLSFA